MNLNGSWPLFGAFVLLPLLLTALAIGLIVYATPIERRRRTLLVCSLTAFGWLTCWGLLGYSQWLNDWDARPPRIFLVLVVLFGATGTFALGPIGKRLATQLSLRALIGLQAFRLPLELLMYQAAIEGLMPRQMSFDGYNYDVVTGACALLIWCAAGWSRRALPSWVGWAFSALAASTLVAILAIAVASTPLFAAFGADNLNVWVTYFPYVYLPTVMVAVALSGQMLLVRRLLLEREPRAMASGLGSLDQR